MKKIYNFLFAATFSLFLTLFVSCREEVLVGESTAPVEGLPATINLKINVGDMNPGTRFAGFTPTDENASKISKIWIGIYNVNSGILTTSLSLDEKSLEKVQEKNGEIELKDLSTVSGRYYMVAVANPHRNYGVIIGEEGSEGKKRNLEDLLMYNARTWTDYKKISVLLSNPISVSKIGDGFPMSGCYNEGNGHQRSLLSEDGNPPTVDIQSGNNNLTGRIHLQRLHSYIKFVVQADANITITPISWQVKNVPGASFLLERPGSCEADKSQALVNASDAPKNDMFWQDDDLNVTSQYFYHDSEVFPSGYFVKGEEQGSYTFDFCMMENKHEGIINEKDKGYNEREREFKKDDGSNTGWYSSLVPQQPGEGITPTNSSPLYRNNNATFLELKVQMEYFLPNEDFPQESYDASDKNPVRRIANATYTIHLGNVKYGNDEADINDFNCFRNTNTTYTVTIGGADNIRVEASSNDEIASGAEGTVTDIEEDFINLDCHYGMFNIKLTDEQRRNLTWRIRAPYGDKYIDMANGPDLKQFNSPVILNLSDDQNKNILNALPDNQFYNWIQIVPTSEGVIASYPGDLRLINRDIEGYETDKIPNIPGKGVWYLEDLRNVEKYEHWYSKEEGDDIYRWYTVFIDEYVYEFEHVDNKDSMTAENPVVNNWKNFINKDYRKLWIRLGEPEISKDGESVYAKSIYMITQESIQTYYNDKAPNCLGIEHINESYTGDKYTERWGGSYDIDGRLNTWDFVKSNRSWNVIEDDSHKLNKLKKGVDKNNKPTTFYVPDHPHNYMKGTLVRNRDLNGNGRIEDFELRWFLPSVSTYARIALGSVSLKTPLFNFLDYNEDDIVAGTGNPYSHFLASDSQYLWAEELAATGSQSKDEDKECFGGNIRCVRYIGQSMTVEPGKNNIEKAYSFDEETNTVTLTYYRTAAVRPETEGIIDSHFVGDISSYPARKFKIAKYDCMDENGNRINSDYGVENWIESIQDNKYCGNYHEEGDENDLAQWRIPNISELAIMFFIDEELKDENKSILTKEIDIAQEDEIKKEKDIRYMSCSREYFNNGEVDYKKRFMGIKVRDNISANFHNGPHLFIRCVKDVIE